MKYTQPRPKHGQSTLDRPPLYLADRRIQVGPIVGSLTVDYARRSISVKSFNLLMFFGEHVDTAVNIGQIITDHYGWENAEPDRAYQFADTIAGQVQTIRTVLGEELGDDEYGVIRSVVVGESNKKTGYITLSSL